MVLSAPGSKNCFHRLSATPAPRAISKNTRFRPDTNYTLSRAWSRRGSCWTNLRAWAWSPVVVSW